MLLILMPHPCDCSILPVGPPVNLAKHPSYGCWSGLFSLKWRNSPQMLVWSHQLRWFDTSFPRGLGSRVPRIWVVEVRQMNLKAHSQPAELCHTYDADHRAELGQSTKCTRGPSNDDSPSMVISLPSMFRSWLAREVPCPFASPGSPLAMVWPCDGIELDFLKLTIHPRQFSVSSMTWIFLQIRDSDWTIANLRT